MSRDKFVCIFTSPGGVLDSQYCFHKDNTGQNQEAGGHPVDHEMKSLHADSHSGEVQEEEEHHRWP